mmetsp:Transcript_11011/g.28268  ORF Transcript_11011/g.28268 Transcript_11011/m.28268 type:complete len:372 (-) Transcript_11011:168-1283(-)
MTVIAPELVTSLSVSAMALVPLEKRGTSNLPTGPFQKMVRHSFSAAWNSAMVLGPMSAPKTQHPTHGSVLVQHVVLSSEMCVCALCSRRSATSTSTGSRMRTPRASPFFSIARHFSNRDSSTWDSWNCTPVAARNVKAIFPPISTISALSISVSMTPNLSATLAPPMTTPKGRAGSDRWRPSAATSFLTSSPGHRCGTLSATPVTLACARCTTPKASLTNTSASSASWPAKASSLSVSPAWKRVFSSSSTWPSLSAATRAATSGPTQSGASPTKVGSSAASISATGARLSAVRSSGRLPTSGRPKWLATTTRAPFSADSEGRGRGAAAGPNDCSFSEACLRRRAGRMMGLAGPPCGVHTKSCAEEICKGFQ